MKTSSKILLGVSAVLPVVFGVKNVVDYEHYRKYISSAPFDLNISVNALLFLLPAALLAAVVLFSEKKKRVLAICTAVFAAVSVEEFARQMSARSGVEDSLLLSSPYIAAAVIFAVFTIVLVVKSGGEKAISRLLFCISGAITAGFVIMCIVETVDNSGRDNIMQLFTAYILYGVFFLLPAAIVAETALFMRGKTVLLAVGAAVSVLIVLLLMLLKVLWILSLPAVVSAALCVIFAIKSKRGKV